MIRAKDTFFVKNYFRISVLDSFLAVLTYLNVFKGYMLITSYSIFTFLLIKLNYTINFLKISAALYS